MQALTVEGLEKTYDNGFQALKGVSFSVESGEFFALLGPNGAGKSTTLGIVCGLVRKSSGRVSVCGDDLDQSPQAVRRHLGVVPQEFNFNSFEKVEQIVLNQAGYYGISRKEALPYCETLLKQLDLWEKRHTPARMLSGGMKRRLMIARALIHKPRVLILDEPTAGVDIEIRRSMWEFLQKLNQQGLTIILTTHYLEEAEAMCKRVAIISEGKIITNTSTKALLKQADKAYFVVDVTGTTESLPALSPFSIEVLDEHSFLVEVNKSISLNELFAVLNEKGINVASIRPEANRLESMFIDLVAESKQ
ncbi:ABC transporter ATP-binding protein [Salinibius halmophilus]|uniref:ABC transporter ATP-binding protein n=1 Tax=Salinibius halmophilus TaxID=1853216 RepID=UPI000E66FD01|nr:ABC transporter ATP-binding protein [Salinibius halmophilus]